MKVVVIHGPNLNLLGSRELAVYGPATLEDVNEKIRAAALARGDEVDIHQSSHEGAIVDRLHAAAREADAVLLNPAAYSHTSRAIADAIRAIPIPVVEVHLSNIHAREPWRRTSLTAEAASGIVAGFGAHSYVVALHAAGELVQS